MSLGTVFTKVQFRAEWVLFWCRSWSSWSFNRQDNSLNRWSFTKFYKQRRDSFGVLHTWKVETFGQLAHNVSLFFKHSHNYSTSEEQKVSKTPLGIFSLSEMLFWQFSPWKFERSEKRTCVVICKTMSRTFIGKSNLEKKIEGHSHQTRDYCYDKQFDRSSIFIEVVIEQFALIPFTIYNTNKKITCCQNERTTH